uniref:STI1 domain-containing protein n=1 Tax=Arcella intermedia TaxID=1963864 RepID=A0A6B2L0G5_9EUKA
MKTKGNEALSAGKFEEAIKFYDQAIHLNPVKEYYGNRSLAYSKLGKFTEALADAEQCVKLGPNWARGFQRKGFALHNLRRYQEAVEAYKKGLEYEPNNDQIKKGLSEVEDLAKWEETQKKAEEKKNEQMKDILRIFEGDPLGQCRLMPECKHLVDDVGFVKKVSEIKEDPKKLQTYLHDEGIRLFVTVAAQYQHLSKMTDKERAELFIKQEEERMRMEKLEEEERDRRRREEKKRKEEEERKKKEELERSLTPEQREALKVKDEATAFYKKKDFEKALELYKKAASLDPKNIVYLNNIAAVLLTQKKFDEVLEVSTKAVEIGRDNRAPFEHIGRALQRLGTAHLRKGEYSQAIEFYKKSQTEFRDPDTLKLLKEAEKAQEEKVKKEYINPQLSEKAKEEGNEAFKNKRFAEAVEKYSEAIKRNPDNHVLYTNRATAYTKLQAYTEALKDCDTCLALSPKFTKAHLKKGSIYHTTKQYQKALETYQQGLEIEPENEPLKEAIQQTLMTVSQGSSGGSNAEDVRKNIEKDPELQAILRDPMTQQVLNAIRNGQPFEHFLQDKKVEANIEKLIMAGVIGTGPKK